VFTNCKGDDDVDAKRSRPSIGKPVWADAIRERVLMSGTDQRITSGPAATLAASRQRQASKRQQAVYMAAPERFAKRQIPLAPRAPSIHGPSRHLAAAQQTFAFGGHSDRANRRRENLLRILPAHEGFARWLKIQRQCRDGVARKFPISPRDDVLSESIAHFIACRTLSAAIYSSKVDKWPEA
jgi:hypothetical protein